ncbi:hypothetical protein [Gloeocapsopsis sp. IPPAS B-1203]|nr:hypothetical protein [Gloeocapsopsis sp. IPPAS B-1203]
MNSLLDKQSPPLWTFILVCEATLLLGSPPTEVEGFGYLGFVCDLYARER